MLPAAVPLSWYLILSAILFALGIAGFLIRRNIITVFMSIELMLNAVNLSFITFSYQLKQVDGHIYSFFVMVVAAAEAAVGLAIILGFQTRLNSAITLGLYIMSIIFFKEAVWPHYILLALGVYLIINKGGGYSLDKLIEKRALIKNRWAM